MSEDTVKVIDDNIQLEVDLSALFDQYAYMDLPEKEYDGSRLERIVEQLEVNKDERSSSFIEHYYKLLERVPDLGNYVLVAQSPYISKEPSDSIPDIHIPSTLLYAYTFKSPDDSYYFAYRGTGDGKWVDNGEQMYEPETIMQIAAREYFDAVVKQLKITESNHIIVTGHSKGGNNAQYVTLDSEFGDLVDACYSLDGQGFSKAAIKKFKKDLGDEEYQARIDKMYSINGENDPVHNLGKVIIPPERTFFVPTDTGANIHALEDMIHEGSVDLNNTVPEGPISKFAKKLSAEMMQLSDEDIRDCALSVMSIIERYINRGESYLEGTGNVKFADVEEFCGLIHIGVPLILDISLKSPEGKALLGYIAMDAVSNVSKTENGGIKLATLAAIVLALSPVAWAGASIVDMTYDLFDGEFERSDIFGAAIVAAVIAKSAMFLAANPEIAIAVLSLIAVVTLVNYIYSHWDDIKGFISSVGNKIVSLAVILSAWAENLVQMGLALLNEAIRRATQFFANIAQAINELGNRLRNEAVNFFNRITQAFNDLFRFITDWVNNLFGGASSALQTGHTVSVTVSKLNTLKGELTRLETVYHDSKQTLKNADSTVRNVYSYYRESYVRNCCKDILNEISQAQNQINNVERSLDRKRNALAKAIDEYYKSDQNAARELRKVFA